MSKNVRLVTFLKLSKWSEVFVYVSFCVFSFTDWPPGLSVDSGSVLRARVIAGQTSLPLLATQGQRSSTLQSKDLVFMFSVHCSSFAYRPSLSLQGYQRVRRNSEEELSLLHTHDMEEGNSLDSHSTSSDSQSEEVRPPRNAFDHI